MAKKSVKAKATKKTVKKSPIKFDFDVESNKAIFGYKEGTISKESVCNLIRVVDAGLIGQNAGDPMPGKMCLEAAVAFSLGYEFNDMPKCVNGSLVGFKIELNDELPWASDKERAKGLRRIAVAQLGTIGTKFKWDTFLSEVRKLWSARLLATPFDVAHAKTKKALAEAVKKEDGAGIQTALNSIHKGFIVGRDDHDDLAIIEWSKALNHPDIGDCSSVVNRLGADKRKALLFALCEDAVQVLKKMKTPGSKYLYLTER